MNWKIKRLNCATAFTLPELLVLVGIVAILAAIAVPNFMEARTSTMIADAKDDLRALEVGLEAYRVDLEAYPHQNPFPSVFLQPEYNGKPVLERLTSPINYLYGTSSFWDPFEPRGIYTGMLNEWYLPPSWDLTPYFYTARDKFENVDWTDTDTSPSWYLLESAGPDLMRHYMGTVLNSLAANSSANKAYIVRVVYDPTNGSISRGSIWNVGGTPEGKGSIVAEVIEEADRSRVHDWEQME